MGQLHIVGGAVPNGTVKVSGNKNAALPMLAAALLTGDKVTIRNMPDILDVRTMMDIIRALGGQVDFKDNVAQIDGSGIATGVIPKELCSKARTSILFAAPLTARLGEARLYPPGGDVIGRRRLDGHFYGLERLGAKLDCIDGAYCFTLPKKELTGRELFLDEASVTATEQIMMAAVLAKGHTTLLNAACEPHVVELGEMLNSMGAWITGLGSNTIEIDGVESLHGCDCTVNGDHIEAGSFLALGAALGGSLEILGTVPRHYWMLRRVFERFNIEMTLLPDRIILPGGQKLKVRQDFGGHIPVISDGPWPQYPSDMMSCTIVMATQAEGCALFFEKMFESRIYFVDRLIDMGANAIVCDPHRVVISGPSKLHGATVSSPDIRAGMAMVIAGLCAEGKSVIKSSEIIYRGYANLVEKLQNLNLQVQEIS
ncbi:MAG: UDP-N-acetylglucosamine 1-carboxyvinyltransferase [Lentisphaerae bacterium]|nr:UDP-N-acetylglucosamine 1-carboxyvinyltransferase [Lentisphaerota bacterium]